MNVDMMLSFAGDFGRYQYVLMFLFSLINVLSSFHYFAQTFISVVPEFSCKSNTSLPVTTPTDTSPFSPPRSAYSKKCEILQTINDTTFSGPCTDGWNYTLSYGYSSVIDELDWVCADAWKPVMGQSLFFIGSVAGSMGLGVLADHIGRLHVLVIANMVAFLGNMVTLFTEEFYTFAAGRLIAGIATDSNFVMMYIIVMEYIRPNMRTFGLNLCIGLFYCLGCVVVPWIAVVSTTWRIFLFAVTLPLMSVLFFYLLVPESAQWLISRRRTEDAIKCFQRIAKINKKDIPETAIEDLRKYCEQHLAQEKSGNLIGLFLTPRLRRKTFILIFKSMVITLCYDAISRNVNGLGFSPFVLFSITSATILPACLVILCLQDLVGRKAMACCSLLVSGIFTSTAGVILATSTDPDAYLTLCLAVVGRFGINIAYNSGAQYAVELIPTEVRGQGVAAVHVAGYAATFFSSQILYLAVYNRAIPELLLGGLSIAGAVACLFLPETLNRTLPVTLKDGESFGEGERTFEFACCMKPATNSTLHLVDDSKGVREYESTKPTATTTEQYKRKY